MRKLRWGKAKKPQRWYSRVGMKKDNLYRATHHPKQKRLTHKRW